MKKYIIDTDIGDDVDDTFAIMLALKSSLDIVGITTVFRNSDQRAKMAKYFLNSIGIKYNEIYAGIDNPLLQKVKNLLPPEMIVKEEKDGYYTLPQYDDRMSAEKYNDKNAVDFIIESAKKYKKDLVLLCIGPLTNIAIAIRKEPKIMNQIGEIRIIGGNYSQEIPEWNIACDPESAKIVFTSGIEIRAIGIDTTMKCPLSDEQLFKLNSLKNKGFNLLCDMIKKWREHYNYVRPVMHDPLLIAYSIRNDILTFNKKNILIGLYGNERGKTMVLENHSEETSKIQVADSVNSIKFFEIFDEIVFK